jgi:hypothetical protein
LRPKKEDILRQSRGDKWDLEGEIGYAALSDCTRACLRRELYEEKRLVTIARTVYIYSSAIEPLCRKQQQQQQIMFGRGLTAFLFSGKIPFSFCGLSSSA